MNLIDLFYDIEIIKNKFEALAQATSWFGEDMFRYKDMPQTKEQLFNYAYAYKEANIRHEQTLDLMYYYLSEFDELIQKFHEIEKASSGKFADRTDNA